MFCANDLIALGALEAVRQSGHQVPGDLSIVGFDDIDEAGRATPPLTTVKGPPQLVGKLAAEMLVQRLKGRTESRRIRLDSSLVIRESTSSPQEGTAPATP